MIKRLGLLVIASLFVFSTAFASVSIKKDGVEQGVATAINVQGLEVSDDGSTFVIGEEIEASATADTLTVAESGKTIVCTATGSMGVVTYTLPAASTANLKYTFVDGRISGASASMQIDPDGTDRIIYNQTAVIAGLAAGDKLKSGGVTGDCVTLISDGTTSWYIKDMRGTWTDNN